MGVGDSVGNLYYLEESTEKGPLGISYTNCHRQLKHQGQKKGSGNLMAGIQGFLGAVTFWDLPSR